MVRRTKLTPVMYIVMESGGALTMVRAKVKNAVAMGVRVDAVATASASREGMAGERAETGNSKVNNGLPSHTFMCAREPMSVHIRQVANKC
jgi:hypothetical protein